MKFVFLGTDDFSIIVLDELKSAGLLPVLIVTAPDRPKGRGLTLAPPPVKLWAQENRIPFLQPDTLDASVSYQLKAKSYQLLVVASYGLIIPKHILDIPKHGALNVHPSLLPRYRGPSPIESQILADEKEVGVTIMQMDERMDHGPILVQRAFPVSVIPANAGIQTPTATELRKILAEEGGKLLAEVTPRWIAGEIQPVPQDDSQATYTKKLTKTDGEINLADDGYKNFLKIRAFEGGIGTYFWYSIPSSVEEGCPAVVSQKTTAGRGGGGGVQKIRVKITDADFRGGKLAITRVIPEGKKEMGYEEFLRGLK